MASGDGYTVQAAYGARAMTPDQGILTRVSPDASLLLCYPSAPSRPYLCPHSLPLAVVVDCPLCNVASAAPHKARATGTVNDTCTMAPATGIGVLLSS